MGEMLDWWLSGGDWADLKQNRRIEDIEASHAAEVAAVRSSVSRQTSALDGRLDRLERALLAFVELEDTRAQLNEFADAAAARRFARDLTNRLLGADAPATPPTPPADLPGYWLSPAVKAVVADLYPGTADAVALRAEARRRDDERAELFDALVAAIGGREAAVAAQVSRWFPRSESLDRAEWTIATQVARGRFGPEARAALGAHLAAQRDERGVDGLAQRVLPDLASSSAVSGAADPGRSSNGGGRTIAERAAADLAALAALAAPVADAEPAERPALRDDPLAELLAVLINEGAPGEAPVLHRMATIRTSLAGVGVPAPPAIQTAGDAAGTVWELLGGWLGDRSAPAGHALACDVLAPVIDRLASSLAATASTAAPSTATVAIAGRHIVIGTDGTDDHSWGEQAERMVGGPPRWVRPVAAGGGAGAVICALLAVLGAPGWWAVTVVAAVAAIGAWFWHVRAGREASASRAAAVSAGQRRIDEHVSALRAEHAAARDRAAGAQRACEAVRAALGTARASHPAETVGPR